MVNRGERPVIKCRGIVQKLEAMEEKFCVWPSQGSLLNNQLVNIGLMRNYFQHNENVFDRFLLFTANVNFNTK